VRPVNTFMSMIAMYLTTILYRSLVRPDRREVGQARAARHRWCVVPMRHHNLLPDNFHLQSAPAPSGLLRTSSSTSALYSPMR
jgi:hypothetical protein